MKAIVSPGRVRGRVAVPPSKSMMQRACAAALLHRGTTRIINPGRSEDDRAALGIIQSLGAVIAEEGANYLLLCSKGYPEPEASIQCGESGLSARLFTPIAALSDRKIRVEGSGSLLQRPMQLFKDILPQLGVRLEQFSGFLPFTVQGPLKAADITVDGSLSSQFLSGLLFACAATAERKVVISVNDLQSKPYINLSLQVLREAGRPVSQEDYKRFIIDPALFSIPEDLELAIEPDWSAAAAMLVAGALSGSVEVSANPGSLQADILVLDILDKAGAVINFTAGGVIVSQPPGGSLAAFDADLRDAPDLFPVLSVLAAHCHGVSRLSGLGRLTHKETNRREAIAEMLAAFGVSTQVSGDDLVIAGPQSFKQGVADGKGDHRVVMAAVLCALRAPGASTITGAEAVSKSYPGFFRDLQALGLDCQLVS